MDDRVGFMSREQAYSVLLTAKIASDGLFASSSVDLPPTEYVSMSDPIQ